MILEHPSQLPYEIEFNVPAGATVKQVLVYWNGFNGDPSGDATITLDAGGGPVDVTGTLIGGPRLFFNYPKNHYSTTYRADITAEGLVVPGANSITVSNLDDFVCTSWTEPCSNGASILAIIEEPGAKSKVIQLVDGQDLAWIGFDPPLKSTEPQSFNYVPADFVRDAELTMIVGSASGEASSDGGPRPNLVKITFNGVDPRTVPCGPPGDPLDQWNSFGVICIDDPGPFQSYDGPEWDHTVFELPIPVGTDTLTVMALSNTRNEKAQWWHTPRPASLVWLTGALSIPEFCDLRVDKQVSCDGGANWVDVGIDDGVIESCLGDEDPPPEIKVRYLGYTSATQDLFDCELMDSNGVIIPAPLPIGPLPPNLSGQVLWESDLLECSPGLAAGEPDTGTLTCQCYDAGEQVERSNQDTAAIECGACDVKVDKQISCDGGVTWTDMGYDDAIAETCDGVDVEPILVRYTALNNGDVGLLDCVIFESNPALSPAIPLGSILPGAERESGVGGGTACQDASVGEPDTATIICTCDQTGNGTVQDDDSADFTCLTCDVQVDKQVSCDGGFTWHDAGYADGVIAGCEGLEDNQVLFRYAARNPATAPLVECGIDDSNPVILGGGSIPVPNLAPTGEAGSEWLGDPWDAVCNDNLEGGEPDTATIECTCISEGSQFKRSDQDTATAECKTCDVEIDKQVSCDGGVTWEDDCAAADTDPVHVRYVATNNGEVDLEDCYITESNAAIGGGLPVGDILSGGTFISSERVDDCQSVEPGEPDTAEIVCTCADPDGVTEVSDEDTANIECLPCDARFEKEVSCDGGVTWSDYCEAPLGGIVLVRYVVQNTGEVDLVECTIGDTNPLFPGVPGFTVPWGDDTTIVLPEEECTGELELHEPDTATLDCTCGDPDSGKGITLEDDADIECLTCDVELVKEVSCDGGLTWSHACEALEDAPVLVRYSVQNVGEVALLECTVGDSNPIFLPPPMFGLPSGGDWDFTLPAEECDEELELAEPDTAEVNCFCGDPFDGYEVNDHDTADIECLGCEVELVKEVSCDGGTTWVDYCEALQGNEIQVRYVAQNTGEVDLVTCWIDESNNVIGPPVDVGTIALGGDFTHVDVGNECTEDLEAGEPDLATIYCTCADPDSGKYVQDDDPSDFACLTCDVELAKEVSCDGGATWSDYCEAPEGSNVQVRYFAENTGQVDLLQCWITESNPEIGVSVDVGTIVYNGDFTHTDVENECSKELDDQEPDTATIDCICGDPDSGYPVQDDDMAEIECTPEKCELEVLKTCWVEPQGDDDDDDDDCDGKVLSMKLQYTGEGCAATTNPQEGKAGCEGGAGMAEPVHVLVTDERGNKVYGDDTLFLGDVMEATAAGAGEDKFGSQTDVAIDDDLEQITFHTSCSKPLVVGDQFGSMLLVELVTTEGGIVTLPPPMPEVLPPVKECYIPPIPPGPHCAGSLSTLALRYIGGDCAQTTQDQEGKFLCNGDADGFEPVRIMCFKDSDVFLDTGMPASVQLNNVVELQAAHAGESKLPSQTECRIYDEFDNWLQDLSIHTSCSKRIDLGDVFGSVEVDGMGFEGGGSIAQAYDVQYTYHVTNTGPVAALDIQVVDDQLGVVPGSPIPWLGPGDSVTLHASTLVSDDTINTVTVTGHTENEDVCEDEDYAVVTVDETPPVVECTTKVQSMLLTYIGPDVPGHVTVEIAGDKFRNDPAIYEFPGGLTTGTQLSSPAESGFSVDPTVRGLEELGSKSYLTINGVEEVIHTSCSTPFLSGLPAPLDNPKGDPSPTWFVDSFTQK